MPPMKRACSEDMSSQEYEALKETLELLSIPGFRKSIARSVNMSQVFGSRD